MLSSPFIFFYGPPGSGKSTLSKRLSEELQLPHYDLDNEIEFNTTKTIPEIFAESGESGFRQSEIQSLRMVLDRAPGVVALGGGALLNPESRKLVESSGRVICLFASIATILDRLNLSNNGRPLLDGDVSQRLSDLLDQRQDHYDSFGWKMDTDALSIEEIVWKAQIDLGMFRVSGMGKDYDVRVVNQGLDHLGEMIQAREMTGPLAIVSDENVARYYVSRASKSLSDAGYTCKSIVIPAGEQHKTFETVQGLVSGFLQAGLDRKSTVIALGGGVVGDLAGFAAAIYLRGIRWVAVPTSLLAMVDASLGGKTGADLPQGKNLVGAFHAPQLVLADPSTLTSLPEPELRNGMAEVIKHGLIGEPELFNICCDGSGEIDAKLDEVVRRAMAVKVRIIKDDPYENGERASLNLGHTLGHGLELATDFGLKHGEAVAIGMVAASRLAEKMGVSRPGLAREIENCLYRSGLPVGLPQRINRERLASAMSQDKKRRVGKLRLVLPIEIGSVRWGIEVDDPNSLVEVMDENK